MTLTWHPVDARRDYRAFTDHELRDGQRVVGVLRQERLGKQRWYVDFVPGCGFVRWDDLDEAKKDVVEQVLDNERYSRAQTK